MNTVAVKRPNLRAPFPWFGGKSRIAAAVWERLGGDWSRVLGPTPTVKQGLTAVFLDPPYDQSQRDAALYAVETPVAADVRRWCVENGGDPLLRIALCGCAGEGHEELELLGWSVLAWKTNGGYGSQSNGAGRANAGRERVWFSPHCLSPDDGLFAKDHS